MTELPDPDRALAIVGLACRVPGAADAAAFWQLLRSGKEAISTFSDDSLIAAGVSAEHFQRTDYVRAGGILPSIDLFDADHFGMTPAEAALSDPQHRVFMEVCAEALDHAGHDPRRFSGAIGLYGGTGASTYFLRCVYPSLDVLDAVATYRALLANEKDHLCTRVAHRLDLRGPAISVQTACSTSLLAVHLACQALLSGECDMALAGGVSIRVPQHVGYRYQAGMILSPDGHCRAFDTAAAGTVPGAGAGVVVLRRLCDALAARDTIHAVVLGSTANNDGASRAAYAAPSATGQAAVISEALAVAGVAPRTIDYVEGHGTGTALGDAIEIDALNQVFGGVDRRIGLGSVKTNLGHLDAASGVVGLIKTVLSLEARQLVPSLHYTRPNPTIPWQRGPFEVCAHARAWDGAVRRAGVSSFGIGGTNVHVVLEAGPPMIAGPPDADWQLLVISARTPELLFLETDGLASFLDATDLALADIAWTLQVGRRELPWRLAIVARDCADAAALLRGAAMPDRPAAAASASSRSSRELEGPGGEAYLAELGVRWVAGAAIEWSSVHRGQPRRVALPPRPLDRKRHWIEAAPAPERRARPRPSLHVPSWIERPLALADPGALHTSLIVTPADDDSLARIMVDRGAHRLAVRWKPGGADEAGAIDPASADHWASVLRPFEHHGCDQLVILWTAARQAYRFDTGDVEHELARLVALFTAVARAIPRAVTITLVVQGAFDVGGAVLGDPRMAGLVGGCRALTAEHPDLRARVIDIAAVERPETVIAREVSARTTDREVAWRGTRRWTLSAAPAARAGATVLRAGGVYWITGGLGGIGFTLARHLARSFQARLVLTTRAPDRELAARRRATLDAETADVLVCAADASDAAAMRSARDTALARFGRIDGVIHAAGVPGDRLARAMQRDDLHRVLAPKVGGALVLDALFADRALDFLALCSSMAAFRGGIGQVAYAGANRFLDAFARARNARGAPTVSIAWDAWTEVGMAAASGAVASHRRAISPEEGCALFEHALALGIPAVMASAADDDALLEPVAPRRPVPDDLPRRRPVPTVSRTGDEAADSTEALIARLWRDRLGLASVGRHDDFFQLGGDSLLALELLVELRKTTGIELQVEALLSRSTVAGCAELVDSLLQRGGLPPEPPEAILVPLQDAPGNPLFLVHPIGGHVLFYRELARAIDPALAVVGIRAAGVQAGQSPLRRVEDIAARYVAAIRSRQPHGPYLLGGASFGGMVAFEIARQLEQRGERTALLALLDTPGPGHFPPRLTSETAVIAYYRRMTDADHHADDPARSPRPAPVAEGTLFAIFNAHSDAMRSYQPGGYGGAIVFFRARERDAHNPLHPEAAWHGRAAGGMEIVEVPGNHITMSSPPHVATLGHELCARIRRLGVA